jgi:hypothetical protein
VHWWDYLIDSTGVPINNAEIYVYIARSTDPVDIFRGEYSGSVRTSLPANHIEYEGYTPIKTNADGYFEFWIADAWSSKYQYDGFQKFKIAWSKAGVAEGEIDDISIFQIPLQIVDEKDPTDTTFNKLVSNSLAYGWESIDRTDVVGHDIGTGIASGGKLYNELETAQALGTVFNYPIIQMWNTQDDTFIPILTQHTKILPSNDSIRFFTDNEELNAQVTILWGGRI